MNKSSVIRTFQAFFVAILAIGVVLIFLSGFLLIEHHQLNFLRTSHDIHVKPCQCPTNAQSPNEASNQTKEQTRILLLSAGRSGSTFLMDMLSASPGAASIFEPLRMHITSDSDLLNWSERDKQDIEKILYGAFYCNRTVYGKYLTHLNAKYFPCDTADPLVIKTIRVRREHIAKWINETNIKIIILVRDPRARYNSMKGVSEFAAVKKVLRDTCKMVEDDIKLVQDLPKQKVRLVKYEDIIAAPIQEIKNLYEFMELPFTQGHEMVINFHTGRDKQLNNMLKRYLETPGVRLVEFNYMTYRPRDFDFFKWKKQLKFSEIQHVEEICAGVLKAMNYAKYNSTNWEKAHEK